MKNKTTPGISKKHMRVALLPNAFHFLRDTIMGQGHKLYGGAGNHLMGFLD
jgi:hypothetical protein